MDPAWLREAGPLLAAAGAAGLSLSLALGLGLGYLAGRRSSRRDRDAFAALAAAALRDNTESFLTLAGERFQRLEETAEADWRDRHKALDDTVGPLREALDLYRGEALALDRARSESAGELKQQLQSLAEETSRLAGALRAPAARGRWGELTLRRTAELAGLSEHCDFAEQVTLAGGAGGAAGRPDMLVRLPGGREIAVDAKAPLDAYLNAFEASDEATREAALSHHARQVRRHVDRLAGRGYASQLDASPDFVVLFLPDEGFLGTALSRDRELAEHSLSKGVVLATPATLYALLGAVSRGWREVRLAEGTREVLACARELDERLARFTDHLSRLGQQLGRSVESFNRAVGSLETRVMPQARRMRELGVGAADTGPAGPERVQLAIRPPVSGE